jgi:hypothetical protein
MADWKALEIKIPGKDLLEQARSGLEALVIFLEIIKALLEAISLFLIDFGNPIRPIVEALLALILQLFESLRRTGLYGYFDFPNPTQDPNFDRFKGGYQAFTERFKASLFDGKDPYRPQPAPGINQSGFVLIVADAESVFGLLRLVRILLRFFGKELTSAQYAAPANVKVFPAGTKPGAMGGTNYDPILQLAAVFGADLKGLSIEWSLATNQYPPDPGFTDLVATVSSELIPQKWLIEKTGRLGGPETVTVNGETNFEDKRGKPIKRTIRVRDENGDYFRRFEKYLVIDPSTGGITFFLGQLGTFRYIDTDVVKDKQYYYRVRAFSGPLDVASDGTLNLPAPIQDASSGEYVQRWPTTDPNDPVVMGRPGPIITGRVPTLPTGWDVIRSLEYTFRMAFALGFHLELEKDSTFDTDGRPTGDTAAAEVGRGSLTNIGGALSQIIPAVTLGFVNPKSTSLAVGTAGGVAFSDEGISEVSQDPTLGSYPDVTHNYFSVKAQSARLAQMVGSALLENSGSIPSLQALYQGGLPRPIPTGGNFSGVSTIQGMVEAFNALPADFPDNYYPNVYTTYSLAFGDVSTRLNLLDVVSYIKSFTLGGTPPDWVSVSLLRDIVPWSGQFIYDLLNRIDALLDAFKSALDEIKAFIDALERKIDVLERFLRYLIEMLNYLDSFSAGFYFLNVPVTDRGVPGWIEAIDNAGGTPPPSGPGGYSAGVALAYSGTNVDAFVAAFSLIF